ncbi:O-antigen ligase family protein [Massilia sp. R2A-15]|uniref:O-antigen ligase family protein n=1 Tax=Massilia sp. R2A-15 TaxID=3064278 RepID=UPI002734C8E3|nr:O-antigen ligase family protein [Massilia sp. R2A-15]WLI88261.1 O-antigen ligase family protein [Massilia sp. R2A-15]
MTIAPPVPLTRAENIVRYLILLALFSVSFSTALTNLFVGFGYIGFIVALCTSPSLRRVLRSPPALLALALLALFIIGASWSIAPRADLATALKKYSRLLILPMAIAMSWRDPGLAPRALRWFLGGAAVLAVSCYLVKFGMMPESRLGWWKVSTDARDAYVFRNHITIGILLGFAACLSLLAASYKTAWRARALWIAGGVLFAVPTIFLGQGRTGYVALFIGMVALFLIRTRITPLRTVAGVMAIGALFLGFYLASSNVRSRTDDMVNEIQNHRVQSPNGLRVSFLSVGLDVVAAHPLLGVGTGGFAEAYAPTAQRNWPAGHEMATARHQPHSEFLLVAVQLGLLGSLVYFAMLGTIGGAALGARNFESDSLALLWVVYVVTSSFNSLLWDTTEAHWFLLLAGCLYVGALRRRGVKQ